MTSRWGNPIANSYLEDKEGNLLPGGTVDFYEAGTSTPLAVYSDSDLSVSLGSQITADAQGLLPDFHMAAGTEYKAVAKDSGGATKWTRDDVFSLDSSTDTRLDSLESSVADLGAQGGNTLVNGGMRIADSQAATLSTSFQEGKVKEWDGKVSANVTAGTLTQGESTDFASGHYLHFSGVSTSGSANIIARVQVSSDDAAKFVDNAGIFSCRVYHDIGSATNFTATIYKADAKDDFSSITSVQAGDAVSVSDQTITSVSVTNADLGDVSNGIEIQISAAVGSITTKNIRISEAKLEVGGTASGFSELPYKVEEAAILGDARTPVLLYSASAASGSTTLDLLDVFSTNTGYDYYRVVLEGLTHDGAGNNLLTMRVSSDGSTALTGSTYEYFSTVKIPSSASPTYANSTTVTAITAASAFSAGIPLFLTTDFVKPNTSGQYPIRIHSVEETDFTQQDVIGGYASDIAVTGIQFILSADNFDGGTVRVFGSNDPFR